MTRLWLLIGSVVTVVVLALSTFTIVSVVAHEEVVEAATFDAADIARLRVDNDAGSVEVLGGDVDEITVEAEISHGLRRTVTEVEVAGEELVIDMDCPIGVPVWCSADYRIVVPDELDVDIETESGRLTVRDVAGDVTVSGTDGSVELTRLRGTVDVQTSNGSVRGRGLTSADLHARSANGSVRLAFAAAPTTVTARTAHGSIEIVVPDDGAAYRVEVDNFVGSTDAAVRTDPTSERLIVAITRNGSVAVRYPTG